MPYDLGDPVPLSVQVYDSTGVLANATTVTVTVTQPDGTDSSPSVNNPTTGTYTATFLPTQEGRHGVRWVATGLNASAYTDAFDVDPAATPSVVSLADAKAHLNIAASNTDSDEELRTFIAAASEWVESRIGPVTRRTVTDPPVAPAGTGEIVLRNAPVLSVTSIDSALGYSGTYDPATYFLDTTSGILTPFYSTYRGCFPVSVTYVAGRTTVPAAVRLACLMYVKSLWETQRGAAVVPLQGFDDEGISSTGGLLVYKAEQLLEPYLLSPAVA